MSNQVEILKLLDLNVWHLFNLNSKCFKSTLEVLFFIQFMGKKRCNWCRGDHLYENYHDTEWGVPVFEDNILFESLTLEIFQSGLSWITILKKREGFIKAFDSFDIYKIAAYDIKKEKELIANTNIVRNNLKIKATINNAKAIIRIQEEYNSFSKYIWAYINNDPIINKFKSLNEVPTNTPLSKKICIDYLTLHFPKQFKGYS